MTVYNDYKVCVAGKFSKESVYKFADEVASLLKNNQLSNSNIISIIQCLGGSVEPYDPFTPQVGSGSIFIDGPGNFKILLPTHTSILRDTFTLAHELGHYFLHSNSGAINPLKANRYGSGIVEWEANWFAAGFLMPTSSFKDYKDTNAFTIASVFDVSIEAANFRLQSFNANGY